MKITYENKVNLNTSALPRRNKVIDADMNEIKGVVNQNAGTLLWENDTLTWAVPQNTSIDLDLSSYQSVKIIFIVDANATTMETRRFIEREIEIGLRSSVDHITPYTNQASVVIRQRTFTTDTTGITFDVGTQHTIGSTNSYTVPDDRALTPYKIYGVG